MADTHTDIPSWLTTPEHYRPGSDRDGFISRSLLSITSALAFFRLDDGREARFSPSAPIKLVVAFVCILLVSLSRNYLFVLVMLAAVLVRACLLPQASLARMMGGAASAAAFSLVIMLPAILLGQAHAPLLLATKAFVSVGITLYVALTTPVWKLTHALRSFHMPGIAIMTIDLALRSIVRLGETAAEVLCALSLRSVGCNRNKGAAIGGVGGVVLLKTSRSAQETYDAMRCRCFDGEYRASARATLKPADAAWALLLIGLVALFAYLQGLV